jgi:hypothetical protein
MGRIGADNARSLLVGYYCLLILFQLYKRKIMTDCNNFEDAPLAKDLDPRSRAPLSDRMGLCMTI